MTSFIYLTPLFLYFPRFLSDVETQPVLATGVALLAIFLGRERRAGLAFIALALAMLCWIAVMILINGNLGNEFGLLQLLVGPLSLFGALALKAPPPSRKVMAGVAVYFLMCATLELISPSAYESMASLLLSRISVADGHRGVSAFTPEPTYASITIMYFLLLAWWSGKHFGFRYRWIETVLAICLIATGSTYVGLLVLAVVFARWPKLLLFIAAMSALFVQLIEFVALDNDESIRAIVAVSRLLTTDFSDFLPSISVIDSSLGSRLTTNAASFLTPFHSPLGLGIDCKAVPLAYEAAGYGFAFSNTVLSAVMEDGCLKPQSYAASVTLGLGALSLAFFVLLIYLIRFSRPRQSGSIWFAPLSVAIVVLTVQGQLTNPVPWLLIFLALYDPSAVSKQPRRAALHIGVRHSTI